MSAAEKVGSFRVWWSVKSLTPIWNNQEWLNEYARIAQFTIQQVVHEIIKPFQCILFMIAIFFSVTRSC